MCVYQRGLPFKGYTGTGEAMNTEEAIEILQEKYSTMSMCLTKDECDRNNEAVDMAISALEKQRWILCSERLPEVEKEVLICTERGTITTAIYEDGKMDEDESSWVWHDIDYAYDEEADITYVPEGWYEYEHFCQEDEYNNSIDEVVVKWMPLPEPYKEKQ